MRHLSHLALLGLAISVIGAEPMLSATAAQAQGTYIEADDLDADYDAPQLMRDGSIYDQSEYDPPRRLGPSTYVTEAPPRTRRLVERHIIERYVEEPAERTVVQRRIETVVPPLPIGPVIEPRIRVQRAVPTRIVRPLPEQRYARPVVEQRYVAPVAERRVEIAPACRTVLDRRVDGFGFEEVRRVRICN